MCTWDDKIVAIPRQDKCNYLNFIGIVTEYKVVHIISGDNLKLLAGCIRIVLPLAVLMWETHWFTKMHLTTRNKSPGH